MGRASVGGGLQEGGNQDIDMPVCVCVSVCKSTTLTQHLTQLEAIGFGDQ